MKLTRRQFLRGLALLPWVALPRLVKAQEPVERKVYLPILGADMAELAFPCTGILDDFSGADFGPPPGPNWSSVPPNHMLVRLSNQCARNPAEVGIGIAIWTSPTTANCEAYKTISTLMDDGTYSEVFARANPSDMSGAYFVTANRDDAGGDTVTISSDLTPGTLATYSIVLQAGDSIGIRCCTNRISAYHRPVGGSWLLLGTVVNSDNLASGCIGLDVDGDNERDDDFGGGSISDACCGIETIVATTVVTKCAEDPSLALVCANGDRLDLITWESGFELDDPGWRPQIAQFKGGGSYANSQIAEGQTLVAGEYDNVVETIPLVARGISEAKCIQTYRRLQQFIKRASDYWKEPSEYDDVWLEVRPAGLGCRIGYARVVKASCVDFANPFGQPFFSQQPLSVADGLSLVVEREPLWRAVPPGEIIGPLYNLLKNPDFEEWNSGVADSQPDCWSDVEIGGITGTNARNTAGPKWGRAALTVDVTNSTGAGQAKGVTQVAEGTEDGQEYTVVTWVRNAGVSGGVGRILVTSLLGQYEVYRSATQHGWTLYTYVLTAGVGDVIGVNCEILSTAAGTDGTVYFDSLMLLKGDWEQEAIDGMLPYMSSSHIFNHWDTGAGHLNYVDAWEVPGDGDALTRLEVVNDTTPADFTNVVEKLGQVYVGQRRIGDVQDFLNYHDPAGVADATASNTDRMQVTPTAEWIDVTTHTVVGEATVADNVGRFRVLARLYDAKGAGNPTLEARLAYWLGVSNVGVKMLTGVTLPQRATWNMVGLTDNAAMIVDSKFRPNYPGALSYTVQLRRPTGTGDAYFDFALQLPTEGGFLEAEIDPGLEQGVALVADNTASSSIGASGVRNGYIQKVTLDAGYNAPTFKEFLGNLYVGLVRRAPTQGGVWQQKGKTWSRVYTTTAPLLSVQSLEIYNSQLYGLENSNVAINLIRTSDGVTWSSAASAAAAGPGYALKSFNGKLWIGVGNSIYSWNSAALVFEYALPVYVNPQNVRTMEVFGGRLFVGSDDGALHSQICAYSPTSGWTTIKTFDDDDIEASIKFNDKFYIGTQSSFGGNVYSFDGSTWTVVHAATQTVSALGIANGNLLAAMGLALAVYQIFQSPDGTTWSPFYSTTPISTIDAITLWNGEVTIAITAASGAAQVWTIVPDKAFEYSIANYQMGGGQNGGFTAPNRRLLDDERRHRWVVSADRSDGSNVTSDKMLIGIGYVPRYLALLGEG